MQSIFDQNIDVLRLRLTLASNQSLLDDFFTTFSALGLYQAKNEMETTHLLELSKTFIDEFKLRINKYMRKRDYKSIEDLTKIMQNKLKTIRLDVTTKHTPYAIRHTLRLYAYSIKQLKKIAPKKHIKENYL